MNSTEPFLWMWVKPGTKASENATIGWESYG